MEFTKPTAQYYQKVIDCQQACPAHTPVPEYIRLVAQKKYTEAYILNWYSNRFPGILGRVCDRPCEPACRRVRVEEEAVAICRLKRVAADYKSSDITKDLPSIPTQKNGKRIALIGAGPASLTVASTLLPLGYQCVMYDKESQAGGAMLSQVPRFRLPLDVLNEEVERILDWGVERRFGQEIHSLQSVLDEGYDAIFLGTGAPKGHGLEKLPGFTEHKKNIHIGVEFLSQVAFGHLKKISKNVVVIGGGNTAMDCARTALRLGAQKVQVITPESYEDMLASPWEKTDALHEQVSFHNDLLPVSFASSKQDTFTGVYFQALKSLYNHEKKWQPEAKDTPAQLFPCETVILAIGQSCSFSYIDPQLGVEFETNAKNHNSQRLKVDPQTFQTTHPKIFAGGDCAFGPQNIIWAVRHGHEAAWSIDRFCKGQDFQNRHELSLQLRTQRVSLHHWNYDNAYAPDTRYEVPHHAPQKCKSQLNLEVETGYTPELAIQEAKRCLNCDVQTVFEEDKCIECNACVDICPVQCLDITPNADRLELEKVLKHQSFTKGPQQDIFVAPVPISSQVMVKDENLCIHCGLCAERCPTEAWDMQKSTTQQAWSRS